MRVIHIAALAFFCFAPTQLRADACNWKFTVNNQTETKIEIRRIESRVAALWKLQWHSLGRSISAGQKLLIPGTASDAPPGYSFSTDTACKPNKKIDFDISFTCVFDGQKTYHTRKTLNRVRDGVHTVKISACSDVTTR